MKLTTASLLVIFAAFVAHGVSRVGGGRVSSASSLFEMQLPQQFQDMEQIENMVLVKGPFVLQSGMPFQQVLQIREYQDHFSRLNQTNRNGTIADFARNGWEHLPSTSCIETFTYKNESTIGVVATWGSGRGVTISGMRSDLAEYAIDEALKSLTLQAGACAWE